MLPAEAEAWVLWLDSDINSLPNQAAMICEAIVWAEENERPVVANYRMVTGQKVLIANSDPMHKAHHFTAEELARLEPFAEIGMAGLGFAYIHQPLDDKFHADEYGEDINFWWDCPHIRPHYAKGVRLAHHKTAPLL